MYPTEPLIPAFGWANKGGWTLNVSHHYSKAGASDCNMTTAGLIFLKD